MSSTDTYKTALDAYNKKVSAVGPQQVGYQCALAGVISLLALVAFNILRPRNKTIYEPKKTYYAEGKRLPEIERGGFSWVKPLITAREADLLPLIGLDAVAYLRFLRMLRWLFLTIAVIAGGVLIPINYLYNGDRRRTEGQGKNILADLTCSNVHGSTLYWHIGVTYAITFVTFGFIAYHWKEMVELRQAFFKSPEYASSFYARTLMVRHIRKPYMSDAGLREIFNYVQGKYPATDIRVARSVGRLPVLVQKHNNGVKKLEEVLVKYLQGGQIGSKRPTVNVGGFFGLGGRQVDEIDYYTEQIKNLEDEIADFRANIDLRKVEKYGFVSMASVSYAHIIAQALVHKSPKGVSVTLAPNPKDILWTNLTLSGSTRFWRRIASFSFLVVVCFLNTVPLLVICALANLTALIPYFPWVQSWSQSSEWSFSLVSGVLPTVIQAVFGYFLPFIIRRLARWRGEITRSRADLILIADYYAFYVISQFVVFSLIWVAFQIATLLYQDVNDHRPVLDILHHLNDDVPLWLQNTYVSQSNFWLTWLPLRGYLIFIELVQVVKLLYVSGRMRFLGRTPRDVREWTKPPSFPYAITYTNYLFVSTVGFIYAPLAPLVVVMAALVFWAASIIYKYQLMFVYTTKVENAGILWNAAVNRLLAGAVIMHVLVAAKVYLSYDHSWPTIAVVPLIMLVAIFKICIHKAYYKRFLWYIPKDSELGTEAVHSQRADVMNSRLEKRFGHPALHAELYTPMIPANMAHLIPYLYHGRLLQGTAVLAEYGGQAIEAQVAAGVKFVSTAQTEIIYEPQFCLRDRGEEAGDAESVASADILSNKEDSTKPLLVQSRSNFYAQPEHNGYDKYLVYGPQRSVLGPVSPAANNVAALPQLEYTAGYDQTPVLFSHRATSGSMGRH